MRLPHSNLDIEWVYLTNHNLIRYFILTSNSSFSEDPSSQVVTLPEPLPPINRTDKTDNKDNRRLSDVFSKGLYKMAEPLFQDGERKHGKFLFLPLQRKVVVIRKVDDVT